MSVLPPVLETLRHGQTSVWMRPAPAGASDLSNEISMREVADAAARMARFEPVLAALFSSDGWDGRIQSPLLDYPAIDGAATCLVKADHLLPMTGSIKARGGVHELLCFAERIAAAHGSPGDDRALYAQYTVTVASTGNLGFSIGLVARAFGFAAEIHMSHDAKSWKKERLRALGAAVVEHPCDYSETVARARAAAQGRARTHFIDDENSRDLLTGYAVAASEVAAQLRARGLAIGPDRKLVVYLPCGVGGAPGGITLGLKHEFGADVLCVFVEPTASACMLVALATGERPPPSVYDYGCDNETIADGLAVPRASALVLAAVGSAIDAVVAVPDAALRAWVGTAWRDAALRLEPSAASFAGLHPFLARAAGRPNWPTLDHAVHLFWTTGGSRLPDSEFLPILSAARASV